MKRFFIFLTALVWASNFQAQERIEPVPFGDMEQWAVRYIKESRLIGGKTRILYAIAPTDTIRKNEAFVYGRQGCPWTVSSAYARVAGIDKASGSVRPDKHGDGLCCRLDSKMDRVIALGIIKLKVLVSGTIFTGVTLEPVTNEGTSNPYSVVDMGVPFTKHPVAMLLDYKAHVEESDEIISAKAVAHPTIKKGRDAADIYIVLQKRWEDTKGNIHALRVATGHERIFHSTGWKEDHRIPIYWGDELLRQPEYKDYMGIGAHIAMTRNSKGKMVPIQEEGFSNDDAPTHMIIACSSGCCEAFEGHAGNTLWVDNIRLVYAQ